MSQETRELELVNGAINQAQRIVLTQETPKAAIKERRGRGGKTLSYVEHGWVTKTLNEAFGWAWSWDILEWRLVPDDSPVEAFVLGRLTVHSQRGDLTKTQFGGHQINRAKSSGDIISIADDLKAASSDALKKAASLLGIALDLYSSDEPLSLENGGNAEPELERADPDAIRSGNGAFENAGKAIRWGYNQGAFEAFTHAKNAYNKLKDEKQPTTPEEMAELWRNEVADRLEAEESGTVVEF